MIKLHYLLQVNLVQSTLNEEREAYSFLKEKSIAILK